MNKYINLIKKHQKILNDFPLFFAFNQEQFKQAMLFNEIESIDEIVDIGFGGFCKRSDEDKYFEMLRTIRNDLMENFNNEEFVFDMFKYELANHEYIYTRDISDTINAIGLTIDEINSQEILLTQLKKAIEAIKKEDERSYKK